MISNRLPLALITLLLSHNPIANAQDAGGFDIEAQSLNSALREFAEQTGLQLMYSAEISEGVESQGVNAAETPDEALVHLLADTGLKHQFINARTIAIQSIAEEAENPAPGKARPASSPVLMAQNRTSVPSQSTQTSRTSTEDEETKAPARLEEIVVTGSRIRGADSASPILTIDRVELDRSGFATVEEVIENLPQNFGAGATSDATNGTNLVQIPDGNARAVGGGTSVNLRGLGTSSTLVLVDGRRLSPSGNEARFTNIASIPLTAVERVEVLTDGASAIYGSDAIAGVINFIMRKDYEGAETRLRYGSDSSGDTSDVQFGQVFGTSWNSGNVLFSYEYYEREPLAAADREFTASYDLSPLGGTDNRKLGGNPANIVANGQIFAIPAGQDGRSLTAADFDPTIAPNLYNRNAFDDLIGELEQHSATLFLNQDVGSWNLFGQARFSTQDNLRRLPVDFFELIDIPVTNASPFFVDPTGTGLTEVTVENYAINADIGPRNSKGEVESLGATTGARLRFDNGWFVELVGNWAREEALAIETNIVDADAVLAAANNPDPDMAFNPFGDGSNTNPALLPSLVGPDVFTGRTENELWSVSLNADGSLFDVAGGAVQLATGVDYRDEALTSWSGADLALLTNRNRSVFAAYAEVFFPLVGESNARAGLKRLELSVAARFEDYGDFGNTTNPKVGVLWSPSDALTLRGTYGTSYRAPSLRDLDVSPSGGNQTFYSPAFIIGTPALLLNGANEDLRPEEAVTWTAGLRWRPERVRGLSIDLTYFDIDFDDRIGNPIRSLFAVFNDPSVASLVTLDPTAEEITTIVNDPRYDPDYAFWPFNVPAEDLISGAVPVDAIINSRRVNSAQLLVTGVQLQLAYSADTQLGIFGFKLNGDYLSDFRRRVISADPLVEEVDTMGRPVDLRARGSVSWSRDDWAVSSFINYTDGYTDVFSDPERSVESWTTVDLTVAYNVGGNTGVFSDTRLTLTTRNLFDEDPPFVDTAGGRGYDATVANPLGRYFVLQITRVW